MLWKCEAEAQGCSTLGAFPDDIQHLLTLWLSLHTKPVIQTIGQDDSKISFPSAVSSSEFSIV